MKPLFFSVIVAMLAVSGANAADGSSQGAELLPPPISPLPTWQGVYLGLNAGGFWNANSQANVFSWPYWTDASYATALGSNFASARAASGATPAGYSGFIGGGQIGYNWRLSDWLVAGLETDLQGSATSGSGGTARLSRTPSGNFWLALVRVNGAPDYLGTVRSRLGVLVTQDLLVYGTGGLAYGGVDLSTSVVQMGLRASQETFTPPGMFSAYSTSATARAGWTAGGGVEWLFAPNWSVKAEYLHFDMGSMQDSFLSTRFTTDPARPIYFQQSNQISASLSGNIVRAGLNYHVAWDALASAMARH